MAKSCNRVVAGVTAGALTGAGGLAGYMIAKRHYDTTGDYKWYIPAAIVGSSVGAVVGVLAARKATGCKMRWFGRK
jgi:hypothetical protein